MRKSIPLLRNIDRIVPLSLEIFNRHVARSKVFPYFAETYGTLESGLLFFFCFVHLYHRSLIFSVQKYKLSSIIPNKTSKTCQRSRFLFIFVSFSFVCSLFHWSYHTFYKGNLIIFQPVFLVKHFVCPGMREILKRDELEGFFIYHYRTHCLQH